MNHRYHQPRYCYCHISLFLLQLKGTDNWPEHKMRWLYWWKDCPAHWLKNQPRFFRASGFMFLFLHWKPQKKWPVAPRAVKPATTTIHCTWPRTRSTILSIVQKYCSFRNIKKKNDSIKMHVKARLEQHFGVIMQPCMQFSGRWDLGGT